MGIIQDLLDRLRRLQADRVPWEQTWIENAVYALPDAERFDTLFATGQTGKAIDSVVGEPIAARRSKEIYDQTSLWAIDRGANGTLSLVTPQSSTGDDIASDDPFAGEPTDTEKLFYDTLRDYLFATRANPRSGFWVAHKAAVRCMWGFGTGVRFTGESDRGVSSPISYGYVPLSENHLGSNFEGITDTDFRLFRRSARQCVERWGKACSAKTQKSAADPKEKDRSVLLLHAVYPRDEAGTRGNTNREATFCSFYVEVDEQHLIGESGFWEFPFVVYHWQRNSPSPYSEGPLSLAISDVKSLNMLSKQELRGVQMWIDPPYATHSGDVRLNLNSRAPNPGFLDANGNLLVKPIVNMQRPDFAQSIIEGRRGQTRTTLYVDLWQSLISSDRQQTAYEVMIRNQEKGDLLGPVGSSMQMGLSFDVDREVGILARKGAFETGSPLAPPDSLRGRKIGVRFTSPLDKLRRLPQLQGMTQLAAMVGEIAKLPGQADKVQKIDWDAYIDTASDILDVPQKVLTPEQVLRRGREQAANAANAQTAIGTTHAVGEAAQAAGDGIAAIADNPAGAEVLKRLAGVTGIPA